MTGLLLAYKVDRVCRTMPGSEKRQRADYRLQGSFPSLTVSTLSTKGKEVLIHPLVWPRLTDKSGKLAYCQDRPADITAGRS